MGKGFPYSLGRAGVKSPVVKSTTINVRDLPVTVSSMGSAVGFGTAVLAGLPEGNVLILGIVANLQFSGTGSDSNLTATWAGDFAIGTTATADVTLDGTDVDMIGSTALPAATAEVGPVVRATNAVQSIIDNTDNDLEMNLNVLIDAAAITNDTSVVLTVNGQVYISYTVLGDD